MNRNVNYLHDEQNRPPDVLLSFPTIFREALETSLNYFSCENPGDYAPALFVFEDVGEQANEPQFD